MKLVNKNIGELLINEMKSFTQMKIIVAYFSPNNEMQKGLLKINNLEIIVSDEFSAINPYSLESLEKEKKTILYLPSDTIWGKLHSKIYYGQRKDGSKLLIVTSANFTHRGLFSNCESSIVLDTRFDNFEKEIIEFKKWHSKIKDYTNKIDYDVAKNIYNNRPSFSSSKIKPKLKDENYWILKTTSGGDINKDNWAKFISENVIAIGWGEKISLNPLTEDKLAVIDEISKKYPDENATSIYTKIMKFLSMKKGDFVILMRGFTPNQSSNVYLYGIARITKTLGVDVNSSWWIYKHYANIVKVEAEFPVELFRTTLKKGSLRQAIHISDKKSVLKLIQKLEKNYNIKVSF